MAAPRLDAMMEPLVYDTVRIGERVGPFTYRVPEEFNRKRLDAIGVDEALPFAEPGFLCGQHSWVMRQRYSWGGSVHARCDATYLKPVNVGATIHVTGEIAGKYERRGGRYVVFRLETVDDASEPISRVENTMLLNFREVVALRKPTRPTEAAAGRHKGLILSFQPAPLGRQQILRFFEAEEDIYGLHPSLHNDEAIARAAGLPDIIAPGRYSIGLANCMFTRLYGSRWLPGARYSVAFRGNLLPGMEPRLCAFPTDDGSFELHCRDIRSGTTLLSGTATLAGLRASL
jgi:acyl dehydratase